MRKIFYFIGLLLVLLVPSGCMVVDFLKKNCTIETEIGAQSFICFTCNFDTASPALKKQIESKLNKALK